MLKSIQCPFCFESFEIELHGADGELQSLYYDCEICCHPILIQATWLADAEDFEILADRS